MIGRLLLVMWRMPLSHQPSEISPTAFQLARDLLPDRAVDDAVGGLAVREQEGQAEGGQFRHHGRDRALAVHRHVERAGAQAGQHGEVVAELRRAGDAHLDAAAAALAQQRCHAVGRDAARVAGRRAVAERETHLALRAQDGRGRRARRRRPHR